MTGSVSSIPIQRGQRSVVTTGMQITLQDFAPFKFLKTASKMYIIAGKYTWTRQITINDNRGYDVKCQGTYEIANRKKK